MNRDLVERLREAAGMQDYDMGNGDWLSELLAEAASALEAQEGWVSVKDRLPEAPINQVIVCGDGNGTRSMSREWLREYPGNITHWMPLPAAPAAGGRK